MYKGLELKHIKKIYQDAVGETIAIKDFSYTFEPESFTSIIGPSGCGKSTLLSIIAGLEKINEGEILFNDIPFDNSNFNIGYMLQKDYLLEWRTIYKNILFGLEVTNNLNDENIDYVTDLLKKYDLYEFRNKYPSQLSGGMRQRVALIRTLAINPDILLLDEAFSALDYQTRLSVTEDVYKIIKSEKKITIMVTHDIPESISMSDAVIVLTQRPATIKNIHNIKFDIENRTPLKCRETLEFNDYFNKVWKELNQNECIS